jgi:hypothetical protein
MAWCEPSCAQAELRSLRWLPWRSLLPGSTCCKLSLLQWQCLLGSGLLLALGSVVLLTFDDWSCEARADDAGHTNSVEACCGPLDCGNLRVPKWCRAPCWVPACRGLPSGLPRARSCTEPGLLLRGLRLLLLQGSIQDGGQSSQLAPDTLEPGIRGLLAGCWSYSWRVSGSTPAPDFGVLDLMRPFRSCLETTCEHYIRLAAMGRVKARLLSMRFRWSRIAGFTCAVCVWLSSGASERMGPVCPYLA